MTLIRYSLFENDTELAGMRARASRLAAERKETLRRRGQQLGVYSGGGGSGSTTPFDHMAGQLDDSSKAKRQYESFRDTVWTATRPIAVRAAGQSIRCGFDAKKSKNAMLVGLTTKTARTNAIREKSWRIPGFEYVDDDEDMREIKAHGPKFIRKSIGDNVEPVENHFLTALLQSPNEFMTGYGLKQCSFASMVLTGRYVWWFDTSGGERRDVPELGNLRLWYLPRSWVKHPDPSNLNRWRIQAPGMAAGYDVTIDELFMSTCPDPGNPLLPFSVVQAQAKAIDTEGKMLQAQAVSMDNAMRPGLVVIAGRLPGMPTGQGRTGPGNRPILSGEQRGQIIDAIKMQFAGVHKWQEPLILDGLIEDIKPYLPAPAELDMVNSTGVFQKRIMEGIGTSPVIAGFAENANRAGSVVSLENFYSNTLNPYIEQSSQDMDSVLGRRFTLKGSQRLRVWMDMAVADDPDAILARVRVLLDVMTIDEKREFLTTGKVRLAKLSPKDREQLMAAANKAGLSAAVGDVPERVVTGQ